MIVYGSDNEPSEFANEIADTGPIEDLYPLSPMQQGMLFHSLSEPTSGVNIEQMIITLHDVIDVGLLRTAWERVIHRHGVLRIAFVLDGAEPMQQVVARAMPPWYARDLTHLAATDQHVTIQQFLQEDRRLGFDLSCAPLIRLTLFHLQSDKHLLIWSFHHAILDGRSMVTVLNEVFAWYEAVCAGAELSLTPPRKYRDYIEWLNKLDHEQAASYWRSALAGLDCPTALTAAVPHRGHDLPPEDGHLSLSLSAGFTQDLRAFAERYSVTPNTLLQGAWALLLGRYLDRTDVAFGVTRACRRSAMNGANDLVGLIINTVPLRIRMNRSSPVSQWLREIRNANIEVRSYEHTPLTSVQRWRSPDVNVPLFDTLLLFENYDIEVALQAQGGDWAHRQVELREKTNYAITVAAYLGPELRIHIGYDASRFDLDTVSRLAGHLKTLLADIISNPETPLARLQMLPPAERQDIVFDCNATRSVYHTHCMHRLFEQRASATPDAPALMHGDQQLTYGELNRSANRLAHFLRKQGVGPETRVAVFMQRSLQMVVSLLGILKAGGAYVPIDPAYPAERIAFMLDDCQASLVLTQEKLRDRLDNQGFRVVSVDTEQSIAAEAAENLGGGAHSDNLAYVIYTSGSTGQPKGVAIEHYSPVALVNWALGQLSAEELSGVVFSTSICFDLSVYELFVTLCGGGRVLLVENALSIAEMPSEWTPTLINTVPSAMAELLRMEAVPASVVRVNLAGEPLSALLVDAIYEKTSVRAVYDLYGPSEDTTYSTFALRTQGGAVTIGQPIANTVAYVLDSCGGLTPVGVAGELYLGGEGLARCYLNRPELTAEKFVPDPFSHEPGARLYRTGDLVRRRSDGTLEFIGRLDHQVKVRGFRIELGEIESTLLSHPSIRGAVVVAREDEPSVKRLVAYLVGQAGIELRTLRAYLEAKLPDYMVPSVFVFLESLPLSPNGKIDRKALPVPGIDRMMSDMAFVAPRNDREAVLAQIWSDLLRIHRVGVFDNFFELGGDSILSLQIVGRARQAGIHLRPNLVFEHPCIADLIQVAGENAGRLQQDVVSGEFPATPVQRWLFERDLIDPHHFNQVFVFEAQGPVDTVALKQVFAALVEHHEALRLRFHRSTEGWVETTAQRDEHNFFAYHDIASLSGAEQDLRLQQEIDKLQRSLDLEAGPLARCALFQRGKGTPAILAIVVHHLGIDGVSWRILYEDIERGYRQSCAGSAIGFPDSTTSFQRWAQRLEQYAQSAAATNELEFWLAQSDAGSLPIDLANEPNTVASQETVSITLDEPITESLLRMASARSGARIEDALIAALAHSVARWTGKSAVCLHVEGHGREDLFPDVDLSRTVGWFTSIYPVRIEMAMDAQPAEQLDATHRQMRAIPNRGVGYGILRYLSTDPTLHARLCSVEDPQISFNYLGQFDQMRTEGAAFVPAAAALSLSRSKQQHRAHMIEVDCFVLGGQLTITWAFSRNLHVRETIERLAHEVAAWLERLVSESSVVPPVYFDPDFPEMQLTAESLDLIIGELNL